jgi:hypothetical protein
VSEQSPAYRFDAGSPENQLSFQSVQFCLVVALARSFRYCDRFCYGSQCFLEASCSPAGLRQITKIPRSE